MRRQHSRLAAAFERVTAGGRSDTFAACSCYGPLVLGAIGPVLSLGLVLGAAHATDPDHVVAVTTLAGERTKVGAAARIGALWGLGHTLTVFVVGGAIILSRWAVPERLGLALELGVAVMLMVLGVRSLKHPHAHPRSGARSLGVGVVHGLAGSAAIALAVLTQVREPELAVAYLLCFGLGTIVSMATITCVVALPFIAAERRSSKLLTTVRKVAGAGSIALGLFLAAKIGFWDGLFL
jgi:high-affinity nickel-transport protein